MGSRARRRTGGASKVGCDEDLPGDGAASSFTGGSKGPGSNSRSEEEVKLSANQNDSEEEEVPKQGPKLVALVSKLLMIIVKWRLFFSVLLFVFGCLWILLFPLVCITTGELKTRGTYFSENALSPGGSVVTFSQQDALHGTALTDQVFGRSRAAANDRIDSLAEAMRGIGLETHVHRNGAVSGVLWPTSGADRREAIILVTKIPADEAEKGGSGLGVGLGLSLMRVLSKAEWLSKNVIFVAAGSAGDLGEWLNDYHLPSSVQAHLMPRAGAMIGGIVLDLAESEMAKTKRSTVSAIEILAPGINGQLPNLDLVNVVVYLLRGGRGNTPGLSAYGGHTSLRFNHISSQSDFLQRAAQVARDEWANHGAALGADHKIRHQVNVWIGRMENMLRFMHGVAFGPTGWHGMLLPYNIHALTLAFGPSHGDTGKAGMKVDAAMLLIARVTEQSLRCMSNLEEKFHQSYFLYLLPDLDLFVSIGEFFGPLVLLLGPLIINLVAIALPNKVAVADKQNKPGDILDSITFGGALFVFAIFAGLGLFSLSEKNPPMVIPAAALATLSLVSLSRAQMSAGVSGEAQARSESVRLFLQFAVFIVHIVIGVFNFPFAYASALLLSPFYASVHRPSGVRQGYIRIALIIWWFTIWGLTFFAYNGLLIRDGGATPPPPSATMSPYLLLSQLSEPVAWAAALYTQMGVMHLGYFCLLLFPAQALALTIILV